MKPEPGMEEEYSKRLLQTNRIIIMLLGILCAIALGGVLYLARSFVLPFALAVFIYYVLNPVITFFEKRHVPTVFPILLVLFITFLSLNLLGIIVFSSVKSFAANSEQYEEKINGISYEVFKFLEIPLEHLPDETAISDTSSAEITLPEDYTQKPRGRVKFSLWQNLKKFSISGVILKTLGSILNFLSDTVLVMLFLLFILAGRNQLTRKIGRAFKPEVSEKISVIVTNTNRQIQKYLVAKTFISLFTGFLVTVVLLGFGVEFALVWGILTFLLNYIPTIGSIIATLLPLGVALLQFVDHPVMVIWIALCLVLVQFSIANLLEPRIMGRSLNLSPLVVLTSLMFWGWLWGIIGMFLAVPLAVIGKIIFENISSMRFISVLMSAYRD